MWTHLWATCHMRSHSVTYHQTQVNVPHLNPIATHADTWFTYPWGTEGWVDLNGWLRTEIVSIYNECEETCLRVSVKAVMSYNMHCTRGYTAQQADVYTPPALVKDVWDYRLFSAVHKAQEPTRWRTRQGPTVQHWTDSQIRSACTAFFTPSLVNINRPRSASSLNIPQRENSKNSAYFIQWMFRCSECFIASDAANRRTEMCKSARVKLVKSYVQRSKFSNSQVRPKSKF